MLIYANLQHGVQMFSQISHTPILYKSFEQKGVAYMPVFLVVEVEILALDGKSGFFIFSQLHLIRSPDFSMLDKCLYWEISYFYG